MKYSNKLTSSVRVTQLLADHSSIIAVPRVITHCPPLIIDAHFHSTLILIGASHQTNISIGTVVSLIYYSSWHLVWFHATSQRNTNVYLGTSLQHPMSGLHDTWQKNPMNSWGDFSHCQCSQHCWDKLDQYQHQNWLCWMPLNLYKRHTYTLGIPQMLRKRFSLIHHANSPAALRNGTCPLVPNSHRCFIMEHI